MPDVALKPRIEVGRVAGLQRRDAAQDEALGHSNAPIRFRPLGIPRTSGCDDEFRCQAFRTWDN
jgi:hypothetical protein